MTHETSSKHPGWIPLMEQVEANVRAEIIKTAATSQAIAERLEQDAAYSGILGTEAMRLQAMIKANAERAAQANAPDSTPAKKRFHKRESPETAAFRQKMRQAFAEAWLSLYLKENNYEPLRTPALLSSEPQDVDIDSICAAALSLGYVFEVEVRPLLASPTPIRSRLNIYQVLSDEHSGDSSQLELAYSVRTRELAGGVLHAALSSPAIDTYVDAVEQDFHSISGNEAIPFDRASLELPESYYLEPIGLIMQAAHQLKGLQWDPRSLPMVK